MGTGQTGQRAPDSTGLLASPEPQDQDYNHTMALFCALHALKNLTGKTELNMFRQETEFSATGFSLLLLWVYEQGLPEIPWANDSKQQNVSH